VAFTTTPKAYLKKKKILSMKEQLEILRKPNKSYEKYIKRNNYVSSDLDIIIINKTKSPPRKTKKLVAFTTTPKAYLKKKKILSMKEQLEILRR
jgi:hypothetical protein